MLDPRRIRPGGAVVDEEAVAEGIKQDFLRKCVKINQEKVKEENEIWSHSYMTQEAKEGALQRLYARTRDRTHALDTLRLAALRRIGHRLGLPRGTHVDEVVRAAARATGRPPAAVGAVLVGGPTTDDRSLRDGATALDELERAVRAATGSPDPRPTTTRTPHRNRRGARP